MKANSTAIRSLFFPLLSIFVSIACEVSSAQTRRPRPTPRPGVVIPTNADCTDGTDKVDRPACATARRELPEETRVCSVILPYKSFHAWGETTDGHRRFSRDGIPEHPVGLFPLYSDDCACGRPSAIKERKNNAGSYLTYGVPFYPGEVSSNELSVRWPYLPEEFGIAISGVEFDPTADEWFEDDRCTGWKKMPCNIRI